MILEGQHNDSLTTCHPVPSYANGMWALGQSHDMNSFMCAAETSVEPGEEAIDHIVANRPYLGGTVPIF